MTVGISHCGHAAAPSKVLLQGFCRDGHAAYLDNMARTQGATGSLRPMYRGAGTAAQKDHGGTSLHR